MSARYFHLEATSSACLLKTFGTVFTINRQMADSREELNKLFAIPPATEVERDVMLELQSILRLQSIDPEQLSHKWEAYAISMGVDSAKMDLPMVRAFKKDLQELLEKDAKGKSNAKSVEKRRAFATPRAGKETNFFGKYVKTYILPLGMR